MTDLFNIEGIERAIANVGADIAVGGAGATAGQFQVDLQTMYESYAKMHQTYQEIAKYITQLEAKASEPVPTSEIAGVQAALDATQSALFGEVSLSGALRNLQNAMASYLTAVSQVYRQYIKADEDNARVLNAAYDPSAAKIALPDSTKLQQAADDAAATVRSISGGRMFAI